MSTRKIFVRVFVGAVVSLFISQAVMAQTEKLGAEPNSLTCKRNLGIGYTRLGASAFRRTVRGSSSGLA